jgi:Tol biopolymer transport system component
MSPEQARGKAIDKRTDIWAFGCVLFEMLTGKRAFGGETTSDVIAAILERRPDLSHLPAALPFHVRRLIERCLEKDPKRRIRDIGDVRAELDQVETSPELSRPSSWRVVAASVAAVSMLAVLAIAAWRWSASPAAAPQPIEFTVGPPPGHTLALLPSSVSPDGRLIAFVARDAGQVASLWVRPIDGSTPRRLNGTEGANSSGHWSPDGRSLAFFAANAWKRIAVDGGTPITLAPDVVANLGASWGPTDTLLLAPANRAALVRVHASGGMPPTPVTKLDTETENSHRWPFLLPDGRHFLFTVRSDRPENLGIKLGALDSTEIRTLVNTPSPGIYADGWLLFMTPDEVLMAQRLDPATWTLSGERQPLAAPVRYNGPSFAGIFSASRDGRVLTYVPGSESSSRIVWFDRSGKSAGTVGPPQRFRSIAVSRDGRTIAAELASARYGTRDIWLIDTSTHALTQLTSNPATDWQPVFSGDGSSIAFASDRAGASTVFRVAINGTGGESLLYRDSSGGGAFPQDWSRDGQNVLVNVDSSRGRGSEKFVIVPIDGTASSTLLEEPGVVLNMPSISPDGNRIAFAMGAPGAFDVYVMSTADRRRARVSVDGGWNPKWGPDGRELFFENARGIMRAVLSRGGVSVDVPPAVLFRPCQDMAGLRFETAQGESNYDVTADGRFVVLCDPEDAAPGSVTVVVNWQSKLR